MINVIFVLADDIRRNARGKRSTRVIGWMIADAFSAGEKIVLSLIGGGQCAALLGQLAEEFDVARRGMTLDEWFGDSYTGEPV